MHTSLTGTNLRKGLVIFQFTLTVILIACSLVVYDQINYIRAKNMGYDREAVISFTIREGLANQFESFRNEALAFPEIKKVSRANASLVQVLNQNNSVKWPGKPDDSRVMFRTVVSDFDFPETMGLELVEGRFFNKDLGDTSNFVISEHAAEVMGLENPIGQQITQWGNRGTIVGIVKNFHVRSLHEALDPVIIMAKPLWTNIAFVRVEASQTQKAIQQLSTLHKKYNPRYDFVYSFIDEDFEKLYDNEKVTGSLALGFTAMAIIISGLGLLGLAAYTAERKRKEISIRKTMGASVTGIVARMSTDFAKLGLVAALIGCPVAWYLMNTFLNGYAYHATLSWTLFVITALCVMVISLLTVLYQVTKAAIANPVDALRNE